MPGGQGPCLFCSSPIPKGIVPVTQQELDKYLLNKGTDETFRRNFSLNLRQEKSRTKRQQMFTNTSKVGSTSHSHRGPHWEVYLLPSYFFLFSSWPERVHPLLTSSESSLPQLFPLCIPNLPLHWLSAHSSKSCSKHFVFKISQTKPNEWYSPNPKPTFRVSSLSY